jgi:hypothetical protein
MTEEVTILATAEQSAGTKLLQALLNEIRHLQSPWQNTPEALQTEVIFRLRAQVQDAVQDAVRSIARDGFESIVARIESMSIKEDGSKATIVLARGSDLADRVGSRVLIVFADAEAYTDGMQAIQAEADQPDLPLDAEVEAKAA